MGFESIIDLNGAKVKQSGNSNAQDEKGKARGAVEVWLER